MEKKMNVNIDEGKTFYSNEASINFNPTQFFLDFKCIAPRVDLRSKDGTLHVAIEHSVVTVDPYHAKQILSLMHKSIEKYEAEFGEIKKPASLAKMESGMEEEEKAKDKTPIYFG